MCKGIIARAPSCTTLWGFLILFVIYSFIQDEICSTLSCQY
uniref:Uncharacterized protein n=1 Tax=Arundo donax TaxID=35708 RepID=A0A0A9BLM0_ARUDO